MSRFPFKKIPVTPSYARVRQRFEEFLSQDESADVGHLVLALLCEESLGGKCIADLGVTIAGIAEGCFGAVAAETASTLLDQDFQPDDLNDTPESVLPLNKASARDHGDAPDWFVRVHERAAFIARRSDFVAELSTEHLLQAMVEVAGPARDQLSAAGVHADAVIQELGSEDSSAAEVAVDFSLELDEPNSSEQQTSQGAIERPQNAEAAVLSLLDANLNRAREGLRVLEDYSRFIAHNESSTRSIKHLRHALVEAEEYLNDPNALLAARSVESDVGTSISTKQEMKRERLEDLIRANSRRVQEALRSLEEFGKVVSPDFAAVIKQLRYESYSVEQFLIAAPNHNSSQTPEGSSMSLRQRRKERLQTARLYVLVTETNCRIPWQEVVEQALVSGADIIQLREKELNDAEIIERGRWTSQKCDEHGALFILNDRVDLAVRAMAHGVHLGQEDVSPAEAREQLPPELLLGLSTHNGRQLAIAETFDIDYLGVGPVMSSATKTFTDFAGPEFVELAARKATLPWFAIGGINRESLPTVLASGASRIAVSHAVIGQEDPATCTAELCALLQSSATFVEPQKPIVPFPDITT